MSGTTFYILFGVTWLFAMAYGLSAFRLLLRVRHMKKQGGAADAPDPLINPIELPGYLVWLLTGRYGELGDPVVRRWGGIARILFIVALPLILAVFAIALSQPAFLDQPT